jgi:hypothetical protein
VARDQATARPCRPARAFDFRPHLARGRAHALTEGFGSGQQPPDGLRSIAFGGVTAIVQSVFVRRCGGAARPLPKRASDTSSRPSVTSVCSSTSAPHEHAQRGRFSPPVNSMKPADRDVLHQAQTDQDGNDDWQNELAIDHVHLPRNFLADPTLWDRSADTVSSFARRTWLVRSRPASNLGTPAGKQTERFGDGRRASLRSPTGSTRTL